MAAGVAFGYCMVCRIPRRVLDAGGKEELHDRLRPVDLGTCRQLDHLPFVAGRMVHGKVERRAILVRRVRKRPARVVRAARVRHVLARGAVRRHHVPRKAGVKNGRRLAPDVVEGPPRHHRGTGRVAVTSAVEAFQRGTGAALRASARGVWRIRADHVRVAVTSFAGQLERVGFAGVDAQSVHGAADVYRAVSGSALQEQSVARMVVGAHDGPPGMHKVLIRARGLGAAYDGMVRCRCEAEQRQQENNLHCVFSF